MIRCLLLVTCCFLFCSVHAQPKKSTTPPGIAAIRSEDLKKDLFAMASDHFRGREAGTPDELRVSVWWAEQLRAAGLRPAGDDGTYFQFFEMERNRIAPDSTVRMGNTNLSLWKDVLVAQTAPASVEAPIVWVA